MALWGDATHHLAYEAFSILSYRLKNIRETGDKAKSAGGSFLNYRKTGNQSLCVFLTDSVNKEL